MGRCHRRSRSGGQAVSTGGHRQEAGQSWALAAQRRQEVGQVLQRLGGVTKGAPSSPQNTVGRGNGARLGAPGVWSFLMPRLNPRSTCEAAEGSRRRLPGRCGRCPACCCPKHEMAQAHSGLLEDPQQPAHCRKAGGSRPPAPRPGPLPQPPTQVGGCLSQGATREQGCFQRRLRGDGTGLRRARGAHKAGMQPTARSPLSSRGARRSLLRNNHTAARARPAGLPGRGVWALRGTGSTRGPVSGAVPGVQGA